MTPENSYCISGTRAGERYRANADKTVTCRYSKRPYLSQQFQLGLETTYPFVLLHIGMGKFAFHMLLLWLKTIDYIGEGWYYKSGFSSAADLLYDIGQGISPLWLLICN